MNDPQTPDTQSSGSEKKPGVLPDLVRAESMVQLALLLPAACFIGWVLGSALDHHFHTTWMVIVGILLGAVAGFVQIIRTASKYLNRPGS